MIKNNIYKIIIKTTKETNYIKYDGEQYGKHFFEDEHGRYRGIETKKIKVIEELTQEDWARIKLNYTQY